jgi:hypothetical protein
MVKQFQRVMVIEKKILYLLLFMFIITKANSQEVKFGWSLGNFGWSYNFTGEYTIVDVNILIFHLKE